MDFQRARNPEQRDQRRRAILAETAAMLAEMPVAAVSLNELSRRVGLAKSNVLRYFESREAILLALLDTELRDWVTAVADQAHSGGIAGAPAPRASARERGDALAAALAGSMAARPQLCDLISAQAAVLERNVSTEVVLVHKRATHTSVHALMDLVLAWLPELSTGQSYHLVATTLLMTSAAWPHSSPTDALLAAYAADPQIAQTQMDFTATLTSTLAITITGLLTRHQQDNAPVAT